LFVLALPECSFEEAETIWQREFNCCYQRTKSWSDMKQSKHERVAAKRSVTEDPNLNALHRSLKEQRMFASKVCHPNGVHVSMAVFDGTFHLSLSPSCLIAFG
jgi:hypothetical protein